MSKTYEHILTEKILIKEYIENKKSITKIAKEFSCDPRIVKKYLKIYNITMKKKMVYTIGMKINKLTILEKLEKNKYGKILYLCLCDCGNKSKVFSSDFVKTKSCGCSFKETRGINNKKWTGYEEITGNFWYTIKRSAKIRNIYLDITVEQIWELFKKQEEICYLSGLKLNFGNRFEKIRGIASLDRINSNKYYTIDNVAWAHKDVNNIKHEFSVEEFIYYCKLISNFDGIFTASKYNFNAHKNLINNLKYRCKNKNLYLDLTNEQIVQKFNDQGGVCAFTGLNLIFPDSQCKFKDHEHTASLDRIDNNLGYTFENVQFVHKLINKARKELTVERYKELCKMVYSLSSPTY